jgi:transcriptional regulator with XRE-family HTH domain
MHLADFMTSRGLSDEAVAEGIGRSRVSVSRYRRRLVRPDWEAIEAIKSFTQGAVLADDWSGPLVVESAAEASE